MREATAQAPGPVENEGDEVLQVLQQIPMKLVVKTVVRPAMLMHRGPQWSRDPPTDPGGPHTGTDG